MVQLNHGYILELGTGLNVELGTASSAPASVLSFYNASQAVKTTESFVYKSVNIKLSYLQLGMQPTISLLKVYSSAISSLKRKICTTENFPLLGLNKSSTKR